MVLFFGEPDGYNSLWILVLLIPYGIYLLLKKLWAYIVFKVKYPVVDDKIPYGLIKPYDTIWLNSIPYFVRYGELVKQYDGSYKLQYCISTPHLQEEIISFDKLRESASFVCGKYGVKWKSVHLVFTEDKVLLKWVKDYYK